MPERLPAAASAASPLLAIERLNFAYGDLKVLWDIDLEVRSGEIVTVVGGNGAGKSTILRNVSRLVRPTSGAITFDGEDLGRVASHEAVARGIVQVPEARRIFPEMTVLENLRMGSYLPQNRRSRADNMERVFALFPRLAERRDQLGGTMSGGEQQMLAIGRGLMGNPKLLLLDEPSLGLSPLFVRTIFAIIKEINAQGTTIMLVEQNVYQSLRISHRAYVLETGRVVLTGTGAQLLDNAHVKKAFLGDVAMQDKKLTVGDWMTKSPITIEEDTSVIEAMHLLKERNIRRLPVMKGGELVGLITEKMLIAYVPTKATSMDHWEVHYLLSKTPVRDAMNPKPHTVLPEMPLAEAAKLLHDRKLNGVLVKDASGKMVGLLTTTNALAALIHFASLATP